MDAAARQAARQMLCLSDDQRQRALHRVADGLAAAMARIQAANQTDLAAAEAAGLAPALLQRLALPEDKLRTAIKGMRQIAELPDPVGRTLRATEMADGLSLYQETVPLGVIACIFESRPDVCIQIPGLTIRTANAVLLKGGKEAAHTNAAIVATIRDALADTDVPVDAVQLLPDRDAVTALLDSEHVDLIIPRGSNALVRSIQERTRIPVMGHAAGICHIYVDAAADLEKAERIILDAKTDYPSACNAVETVLVHEDLREWWQGFTTQLIDAGVRLDDAADFDTEYGDLTIATRTVPDVDAAIQHIAAHGSGHTDCIVTEDPAAMQAFLGGVDSAGVYVNASTRFADGYRYGLGAEVGISTGKLHARGPVGLEGLVSTRWVLLGQGHAAGDFKADDYLHRPKDGSVADALRGHP